MSTSLFRSPESDTWPILIHRVGLLILLGVAYLKLFRDTPSAIQGIKLAAEFLGAALCWMFLNALTWSVLRAFGIGKQVVPK